MKILTYRQNVRLASWINSCASVYTLNGYCTENGRSDEYKAVATEKAKLHGGEWALCGTIYTGSCITSDRGFYERHRLEVAGAEIIEDGEIVLIDGAQYKVRVLFGNGGISPRNSDPIAFDPI